MLFQNALCVCDDLADVGTLDIYASEKTGKPGTLGVNGFFHTAAFGQVQGSVNAWGGMHSLSPNFEIDGRLHVAQHLDVGGRLLVKGNLDVGGNLGSLGPLGFVDVGGKAGVAGSLNTFGPLGVKLNAKSSGPYTPSPKPCDCDPGKALDVKAEVAKAKTQNDNAKAGLPANPINFIGKNKLVFNTGRYYLSRMSAIGTTQILVNGAVSLYVDDSMNQVGFRQFTLTPGSTFDLYVAGNVSSVGHMVYGDKHQPSAFRLYIGGGGETLLDLLTNPPPIQVGLNAIYGSIYAPNVTLRYVGGTTIVGSLFVKSLHSVGNLALHFDQPDSGGDGQKCTPPPSPGSGGGSGGSGGGSGGGGSGSGGSGGGSDPLPNPGDIPPIK